jgi:hemerythrin-like metal-binding protein
MSDFFTWNDTYNTGIKEIDAQHKKLVEILNQLFEAMGKGQAKEVLGKLLDQLIEYTVVHFATEEKLFKLYNYPESVAHKAEHAALTKTALDLQGKFKSGKAMITLEVANFLKKWLGEHIMGSDKKYSPFLIGKGVK